MSDHAAQRECVADDPPGTLERRGWYKSGRKRRTEAAVATVREHIVTRANLITRVSAAGRTQLSITQLRSIYKQRARHPNLGDAIRPHQQVRARVTGDDRRLSLRERPRDMLDRGFESVKGRALASITPPIRSICAAKVDHDA